MRYRSSVVLFVLTLFTFGIYSLVWLISTKVEMNEKFGADIPTSLLIFIPFVNIYWTWKWSEGVERATGGRLNSVGAFLLVMLLGIIGMVIVQGKFNEGGGEAPVPTARIAA